MPNPGERVLLIKPGSMGDVIHALPVAAALKQARPEVRIDWLVDSRWEPLLKDNPHIERTLVFPREKFHGVTGLFRALPWLGELSRETPSLCLDLQGLLRSAIMARASKAKVIVGLSDAREGAVLAFHKVAKIRPGEHSVLRYLRILEPLGIPVPQHPEFPLPFGNLPAGVPTAAYVLVHPFARGAGKSLDPDVLEKLCSELAPLPVVLAGGPNPAPAGSHIHNFLGKTNLLELTALMRNASFVVSVDSGPSHIAAALGRPLLAIHTWSDPRLVGPFSQTAWIWQGGEIRRQDLQAAHLPQGRSPGVPDAIAMADLVKNHPG